MGERQSRLGSGTSGVYYGDIEWDATGQDDGKNARYYRPKARSQISSSIWNSFGEMRRILSRTKKSRRNCGRVLSQVAQKLHRHKNMEGANAGPSFISPRCETSEPMSPEKSLSSSSSLRDDDSNKSQIVDEFLHDESRENVPTKRRHPCSSEQTSVAYLSRQEFEDHCDKMLGLGDGSGTVETGEVLSRNIEADLPPRVSSLLPNPTMLIKGKERETSD